MSSASLQQQTPVRADWLATRSEAALDPGQMIVDPHHHLFDRPGLRYLLDEAWADLDCGHDLRATVFVQARAMLRESGPVKLRPVGETEFADGIAAMCASGRYSKARLCAGIVGFADLLLGDGVRPVLDAHIAAAGGGAADGGRFRGIRHIVAWDSDPAMLNPAYPTSEHMLDSAEFRAGFAHLAPLGLSFDAWLLFPQIRRLIALARAFPEVQAGNGRLRGNRQRAKWDPDPAVRGKFCADGPGLYLEPEFQRGLQRLAARDLLFEASIFHPQLGEVAELARKLPNLRIVLIHSGSPVGHGSYAGREQETHEAWRAGMAELAQCPNISVKLGGIAMTLAAFDYGKAPEPIASEALAELWGGAVRP